MRTHLPPAVQAPAGHAQPEALRAADLVQLFGRLGLAMFLAGLDAVHGSWPLLHCAADQWAALINFCAWRVLPSRRLAPYRSEEHRAWELLQTRERDCLLPKSRGRNVCWWKGGCAVPGADVLRDRLYACHSCVHAPSCINPAHLSWNTPAANRRQAVDAHATCKRRRQASARKAGRVRASKRRTPDPAYRPGRR